MSKEFSIIDSHCHLNSLKDLNLLIERANEANVKGFLTISTCIDSIKENIKIASQFKNVWAAIGIHPLYIDKVSIDSLYDTLMSYASSDKVIGIGETGLDSQGDLSLQSQYFKEHLKLSIAIKKPIIIHSRNADSQMMSDINYAEKEFGSVPKGIFHCYTGGKEFAMEMVKKGFFISASGIVTFKKTDEIRAVFKEIPIENILIETDSPWLAPVPYRGKPNEPSYIVKTAEMIAKIKDLSLQEVISITTNNFCRLFDVEFMQ